MKRSQSILKLHAAAMTFEKTRCPREEAKLHEHTSRLHCLGCFCHLRGGSEFVEIMFLLLMPGNIAGRRQMSAECQHLSECNAFLRHRQVLQSV